MFDLTSEVISRPETLKLGPIGFLSLSATRSFFREALTPSGAERLGGPTDPLPYKLDAIKSRTRSKVEVHSWRPWLNISEVK